MKYKVVGSATGFLWWKIVRGGKGEWKTDTISKAWPAGDLINDAKS